MYDYSIQLYFGLPGCGKSTMLTRLAYIESRKIDEGKSQFKKIYSNLEVAIPHVFHIEFNDLGCFLIRDALILIDEAGLEADARDFKNFPKHTCRFMKKHRHYKCDVIFFNQDWDGLDKKIRRLTKKVYYMSANGLLGRWSSKYYNIPYQIFIPDPAHDGSGMTEPVFAYSKPGFFSRLFAPRLWRNKYYKYFDSFEQDESLPLYEDIPYLSPKSNKSDIALS